MNSFVGVAADGRLLSLARIVPRTCRWSRQPRTRRLAALLELFRAMRSSLPGEAVVGAILAGGGAVLASKLKFGNSSYFEGYFPDRRVFISGTAAASCREDISANFYFILAYESVVCRRSPLPAILLLPTNAGSIDPRSGGPSISGLEWHAGSIRLR